MLRLILAYTDPGSGDMTNGLYVTGAVVFAVTIAFLFWAFSRRGNK